MSLKNPLIGLPTPSIKGESEAEITAFSGKLQAVCISGSGHRTALESGGTSISLFHRSACSGKWGIHIDGNSVHLHLFLVKFPRVSSYKKKLCY